MPSEAGVDPLGAVLEGGLVVSIPHLEGVGGIWFAHLLHLGMVQDVGVQAPRILLSIMYNVRDSLIMHLWPPKDQNT